MPNRRGLLKLAAAGGAVYLVPLDGRRPPAALASAAVPVAAGGPPGRPGHAAHAALGDVARARPFAHSMPIPPILRPSSQRVMRNLYRLHMRKAKVEIIKGLKTSVRSYDGYFPGPTIMADRGHEVVVEQYNDLDVTANVHLHGGHVESEHDGLPMATIAPGDRRTYRYPNNQVAASLWYHDHAHELEAENVFMGLHGTYLLSDEHERALPLPKGQYDVPLVIRDARIEEDGALKYARPVQCPHMLVNGKERPYFEVAARKYRFRLYNVSVNRNLTLRLSDRSEFVQIASDGGLLSSPVLLDRIELSGAERVEVVVDFSRYRVGSSVVLENTAAFDGERTEVLRFDIVREAPDASRIPKKLAELPPIPKRAVEREFALTGNPDFLINGKSYDPDRVDVRTTLGSNEVWRIRNVDTAGNTPGYYVHHSFHIHLLQFRVVHRNEKPVGPSESGWKDTVSVPPGESVCIAMTWGDYPGEYVYHCHHLGHSSVGQMGRVDVLKA